MKSLLYIILFMMVVSGCKKSSLFTYQDGSDIYFHYDPEVNVDSAIVTFRDKPDVFLDTVKMTINTIGKLVNRDRPYKITVDREQTTAVEGRNYQLPPNESFYIPADSSQSVFDIKIIRPQDFLDSSVTLVLQLEPNEEFTTNMKSYNPTATHVISTLRFKIVIDNTLVKPGWWDNNSNYMGTFSKEKLRLLVEKSNLDFAMIYAEVSYTTNQLQNYARQLQVYLNDQKMAGTPILEKDGTEMKMGLKAQ